MNKKLLSYGFLNPLAEKNKMAMSKPQKQEEKNMPVLKVKSGRFSGAVFVNKKDDTEYDSIQIQRNYTIDEGKTWNKESINLMLNDIPYLMAVLNQIQMERSVKVEKNE